MANPAAGSGTSAPTKLLGRRPGSAKKRSDRWASSPTHLRPPPASTPAVNALRLKAERRYGELLRPAEVGGQRKGHVTGSHVGEDDHGAEAGQAGGAVAGAGVAARRGGAVPCRTPGRAARMVIALPAVTLSRAASGSRAIRRARLHESEAGVARLRDPGVARLRDPGAVSSPSRPGKAQGLRIHLLGRRGSSSPSPAAASWRAGGERYHAGRPVGRLGT
jgi:hypothetical protein